MAADTVHLAELLAALSLAADLGMGRPLEHTLRATYLAGWLAIRVGLDEATRAHLFYASLLQEVGCVSYAHETVETLRLDDVELHSRGPFLERSAPEMIWYILGHAGSAGPLIGRPAVIARLVAGDFRKKAEADRTHCEVGAVFARRLGLGEGVAQGLLRLYERWDGKGLTGVGGEDIPVVARVIAVASFAEVFYTALGERVMLEGLREQEGLAHDPTFSRPLRELLAERPPWPAFEAASFWSDLLALEPPSLRRVVSEERIEEVAEAFADFTDFKSPYYLGHSRGVARLAEDAARRMGLPEAEAVALRRAGLLHDLGRVGVSNVVLDKRGAPSVGEWERIRLHPYHAERILGRTPALAHLAGLAGAHHERLDGSGYHRGARAVQLPLAARVLAAADACYALREDRPHRRARSPEAAAAVLRQEAAAGRLDGDCVEATVSAMAGAPRRRGRTLSELSPRELEVLRLLARGHCTREVARELDISERTAHHHIEHVYGKLGVSTRAGAVLEAIARGLADEVMPAPWE